MVGRKSLGVGSVALAVASTLLACGQGRGSASEGTPEATGAQRASLVVASTTRLAHGDPKATPAETLGYRAAVSERIAMGAPAVTVDARGTVYVLDALKGRVMRMVRGEPMLPAVENLPKDVDDLAVGPDGAIAVRRSVKPEVLVFSASGAKVGAVDTGAVEVSDGIALGLSRRVLVTSADQETFFFGSPATPQVAEAVRANKREGAVLLADGRGVVGVRRDDGVVELRVVANDGDQEHRVQKTVELGAASSVRIVGANGSVVCTRIEHGSQAASGEIVVDREAACVDVLTGRSLLRVKLPGVGTYVPRHELAFAGGTLVHLRPTDEGLELTTWSTEAAMGGAR